MSIPQKLSFWHYRWKFWLGRFVLRKWIKMKASELRACFLPWNALEQNSKSLLLFLFHRTEFHVVFSSVEWFRTKFWECASIFFLRYVIPSIFLFHGMVWKRIPRVFCSANHLFHLFRLPRNYFCQKFPTLPSRSIKSVRIFQYVFHIRENTSLKNIDDICLPLYAHGIGLIICFTIAQVKWSPRWIRKKMHRNL